MRILLGHNFYQSSAPSGEDVVYHSERALLAHAGHEVICFERHNDDISTSLAGRAVAGVGSLWSRRSYRDLRTLLTRTRPDIAHFHNTFPLITASAYRACYDAGVPVVQTLHNYRLLCPNGLLLREGRACEDCIDSSLVAAIRHACYRNSRLASAAAAAGLQLNRALGSYSRYVDRYIALTAFAKARFVRGGLPAERITIRPNALCEAPLSGSGAGGYALYVGRLTPEKGAETLLRAWQTIDALPLKLAGDGALRESLQAHYHKPNIEFLGLRRRSEVWELMRDATVLIIPSQCYEGLPLTLLEAFASATPVVVSAIGALDELVTDPLNGRKFTAGDPASLRSAVLGLLADREGLERARQYNRRSFEQHYSAESALASLHAVYAEAIARRRPDAAIPDRLAQAWGLEPQRLQAASAAQEPLRLSISRCSKSTMAVDAAAKSQALTDS